MTVWPSGLRRWLKAPFRKGVGSNPTAVNGLGSLACRTGRSDVCRTRCKANFAGLRSLFLVIVGLCLPVPVQLDTLGIEPRASRMLSGCDTTTPCALEDLGKERWSKAAPLSWRAFLRAPVGTKACGRKALPRSKNSEKHRRHHRFFWRPELFVITKFEGFHDSLAERSKAVAQGAIP